MTEVSNISLLYIYIYTPTMRSVTVLLYTLDWTMHSSGVRKKIPWKKHAPYKFVIELRFDSVRYKKEMQLVCLTVFDACDQISIQILAKFKQKICTKMMNPSITLSGH